MLKGIKANGLLRWRRTNCPVAGDRANVSAEDFSLFIVRTAHGSFLSCADPDGRGTRFVETQPQSANALLCAIHPNRPELAFFISRDADVISIRPDNFQGMVIPVDVLQPLDSQRTAFRHAISPARYLGALGSGVERPENTVVFDRGVVKDWELFSLIPWTHAQLSKRALSLLNHLRDICSKPIDAAAIFRVLQDVEQHSLVGCLLRVLSTDELERVARECSSQGTALAGFRKAIPDDYWFRTCLPALLNWNQSSVRTPSKSLQTGPEVDFLERESDGACLPSNGLILTTLARAMVAPQRSVCIVASARNEGVYLLDWIAYHRAIGIEHIFLYSNQNTDGSEKILRLLADAGVITWIDNHPASGTKPQIKAYGHAFTSLPDILDFRWTAVIDIDEYLCFDERRFPSFKSYLNWHDALQSDAVALSWIVYGSKGALTWSDACLPDRFQFRDPRPNVHVKSVFRTAAFWHSHSHFPYPTMFRPFAFRNGVGNLHAVQGNNQALSAAPTDALAWINHYFFKSAVEFIWKWRRGRGTSLSRDPEAKQNIEPTSLRNFIANRNSQELVRDDRGMAFNGRSQAELERLRAISTVADAERELKQRFAQQLQAISTEFAAMASTAEGDLKIFADLFANAQTL